jgi:S1-C subfamily serine protease
MNLRLRLLFTAIGMLASPIRLHADELGDLVRQAVQKVDPSIVRLRVIGGEQSIDGERVSSLVTTGVVISNTGDIITSQFALQGNPEAVLVEDGSGNKANAKVVATDHVRRLVLLRANEGKWKPATPAPSDSILVGQYSVAAGRFYATDSSSVSVGVISALKRVHGMAIQTDAKVSPINYGGPLLNLKGEVQGIMVPLSPRAQGNSSSGVEWYDSGIGFAVPMTDVLAIAERLTSGKDMKPGRLGMRMKTNGMFSSLVIADRVLKGGPADIAGIRKGDRLVVVNGRPLERISILEEAIASRYAGDSVSIDIIRGEETLSLKVELAEELPVLERGELGFLHVRVKGEGDEASGANGPNIADLLKGLPGAPNLGPLNPGRPLPKKSDDKKQEKKPEKSGAGSVSVAVLEGGAAAAAGLPAQIDLVKIGDSQIGSTADLFQATSELNVGDAISIEYRLPDSSDVLKAELTIQKSPTQITEFSASVLEAVSMIGNAELLRQAKMKTGTDDSDDAKSSIAEDAAKPQVDGIQRRELKFDERGRAIVFSSSKPSGVLPGVVVLLSANDIPEEQILGQWRSWLESHHLILAIPINPDNAVLTADDVPLIMTTLNGVSSGGRADLRRVVAVADREQSRLALTTVFGGPSPIRGIAMTSGWFSKNDVAGLEGNGHSVLFLESPKNNQSKLLLEKSREELQKLGFGTPTPSSSDPTRTIADWSLRLRAF